MLTRRRGVARDTVIAVLGWLTFLASIGVVWYVIFYRRTVEQVAPTAPTEARDAEDELADAMPERGNETSDPETVDPAASDRLPGDAESDDASTGASATDEEESSDAGTDETEPDDTGADDAEGDPSKPEDDAASPMPSDNSGPLPTPPADPLANMVLVPAGPFLYGDDNRTIELPAYYIDRYEVSQDEYAQFLQYIERTGDHSRCHPDELPDEDHTPLNWGKAYLSDPRFPVVGLDFWDVNAYAGWVGKRLPTEEEWEKAARGPDGQAFPWGGEWKPELCNWGPSPGDEHTLMPVDSLEAGRSPYGCHHMLGNAAEWTASLMENTPGLHVGRGYCWRLGAMKPFKVTTRMPGRTELRDEGSGLRCALDASAAPPAGEKPGKKSTEAAGPVEAGK